MADMTCDVSRRLRKALRGFRLAGLGLAWLGYCDVLIHAEAVRVDKADRLKNIGLAWFLLEKNPVAFQFKPRSFSFNTHKLFTSGSKAF